MYNEHYPSILVTFWGETEHFSGKNGALRWSILVGKQKHTLGSLSRDVFERRTSTGSEAFFSFIRLDSNKFVLLSFFSLIKTICPRLWTNPLPNDAKSPLPVDVRRSKTLLLKLSNVQKPTFEPMKLTFCWLHIFPETSAKMIDIWSRFHVAWSSRLSSVKIWRTFA